MISVRGVFYPLRPHRISDPHCILSAEKAVNDRLAQTPELYLLALAQFATSADTEVVRNIAVLHEPILTLS